MAPPVDPEAFARALRVMTPERLVVVAGCVLWPDGDPPSEGDIRAQLQKKRDLAPRGMPPDVVEARVRADFESDYNRRFLIRDLDMVDGDRWTPADLIACAEHWAAILRDALQRQVPGRPCRIQVVGADSAADEPLEVCVTFSQSASSD